MGGPGGDGAGDDGLITELGRQKQVDGTLSSKTVCSADLAPGQPELHREPCLKKQK